MLSQHWATQGGDVLQSSAPRSRLRSAATFNAATDLVTLLQIILDAASPYGVSDIVVCLFVRGDDGAMTIKPLGKSAPLDHATAYMVKGPDYIPMMLDIYGAGLTFDSRSVPASPYREAFDSLWRQFSNATGCRDFVAAPVCDAGGPRGYVAYVFPDSIPPGAASALTDLAYDAYERLRALGLAEAPAPPLTARQREALRLCADGKRDAEIAELLGIAPATAHEHIEDAKRRLGVRTRIQAVVIAVRNGWI